MTHTHIVWQPLKGLGFLFDLVCGWSFERLECGTTFFFLHKPLPFNDVGANAREMVSLSDWITRMFTAISQLLINIAWTTYVKKMCWSESRVPKTSSKIHSTSWYHQFRKMKMHENAIKLGILTIHHVHTNVEKEFQPGAFWEWLSFLRSSAAMRTRFHLSHLGNQHSPCLAAKVMVFLHEMGDEQGGIMMNIIWTEQWWNMMNIHLFYS